MHDVKIVVLHPPKGFIFIGVSLFVSRITEKLLIGFSQNSMKRW